MPSPPEKKNNRRQLLIMAGVAIGSGLAGLLVGLLTGGFHATPDVTPELAAANRFVVLPELTVNLRSTASAKLMKIGVTLTVPPEHHQRLAGLEPVLLDSVQEYVRTLDEHDLEGRIGLDTLRAELLRRVRLLAEPTPVDGVLLRTLILQ
ncbi:flagellar basal body-associated FliL family protein [Oleisolibacter albus]|uniref:flagellar basal body-associated FliL family protein n=1 Tax=Oleisolibacter albus TaxID=2171757 RepID=UPI00139052EE|nr:flagellar basal body-associated FliL family protein [Oleisolibacter albus]